ncbi:uncharacterized protein LOC111372359 [Olea europaea var. sylvestris]|uniref:uncharacterized protein LOC111372359 n=1 Tax=Olea europaea var. sylvestris TaxID=158386 RepID=UPI000C1D7FEF|nr:uncharacterized protein LOC111372359 [Olea europaea var. sylvestris]
MYSRIIRRIQVNAGIGGTHCILRGGGDSMTERMELLQILLQQAARGTAPTAAPVAAHFRSSKNLNIVLTAEKHKFVLDEVCPEAPKDDSTESQKAAYEKWHHSDKMACCYILASMSNVLQQKHQNMQTAFDIMESLQEIFGHQSRQARQAPIRAIMNTRMKSDASVRDHMSTMIGHFNTVEVFGAGIDSETQIDMVLETLPEMFSQFIVDYNLHKMDMSLTKLMKELQNAESVLKVRSGSALTVTDEPSYPKPSGGK